MQNNNRLIIIIFLLILMGLVAGSIYSKKLGNKQQSSTTAVEDVVNSANNNTANEIPETTPTTIEQQSLLDIVSSHTTKENCWVIINSQVYNVSPLIGNHPGGDTPLENSCGKDASALFSSRGKEPANPHPSTAKMKLEDFLVK